MAVPVRTYQLKLWNQVQYLDSVRDRIDKGMIRFKVNRDVVTLRGVNLFGIMPELVDPKSKVGISTNRVHLELFDESDNSMVAKSYGNVTQNDRKTSSFAFSFLEFPYLKPNQIYRLEFEYSGPKRRYGHGSESNYQKLYSGRAGTVAVDIVERQLSGTRLVQGLLFQIAEREQLKPTGMDTNPDLDASLEEGLKNIPNDSSHPYAGSEVLLFRDVGFHAKPIERRMSKGLITFRVNKRIELKGMSFFGMLSIDEETKDRAERRAYPYKVKSICVKECDGACYAMGPEKWASYVLSEEKVPLSFIKLTLLGPSEWYKMEFDILMPALRFGKTLAPTQEVDCGPQGKVVFEFDLEKTVNAEGIRSICFSVSEDQTVDPSLQS